MPSLISFLHNNAARFGRLDGETATDLTASFDGRFASLSDAANAGALQNCMPPTAPLWPLRMSR